MAKIVLVSDNNTTVSEVEKILPKDLLQVFPVKSQEEAEINIQNNNADVVLFDCNVKNIDIIDIIRKLKLSLQTKDIRSVLLLPENNINYDILKFANSYITRPFDKNLFLSTVSADVQLSETFKTLSKNNNDLAKSLYQLNVLYNTSTQLAGSLDKTKLIEILTDGLDQGLSLTLCYALILNDDNNLKLIIKSLFPLSKRLEDAIKLRALLNFKNLFSINPAISDIETIKYNKDQYGEHDLNVLGYDNISAPINIENKFYGIIEIFRENPFAQDDTQCFRTLVKQVSPPLQSAILYGELEDTNVKLAKAEEVKSEFMSIVSHELKTPLTSIDCSLDILLKGMAGEITPDMEMFLNKVKTNSTKLQAIIFDLLTAESMKSGKMVFNFEETNINLPVELVKNALESWAKKQQITININLDESLEMVYIDSQKIEQVLNNLISNAIKFTDKNGTIEVKTLKITSDDIKNNKFFKNLPNNLSKEYVQISVKDNGIGISEENWNKIFEQFRQIKDSLSRNVGGSGLGLYIAKQIIEAHKGFIWLNSELGKGSTFYIAIPIMSDKEIFKLSLEQEIQKSRTRINISLISLSEKIVEGTSFINKILDEDVIRKTEVFKEYTEEINGRRYYYSYAVDMESYVFDFEIRKLQTYIKTNSADFKECDILYSAVLYPQDGENIDIIINKLNSFQKGI
jgi:signal transduction histidine kinase/DNA-binding response OmpR family regulator